jgi:hypothetical protein
MKIKLQARNL